MRVLPFESEELNECWLSDRDRFSYEGLNSEERLQRPMLKEGGHWREGDWQAALEHVARTPSEIRVQYDPQEIRALASPPSTLGEMVVLATPVRAMGSEQGGFPRPPSDI